MIQKKIKILGVILSGGRSQRMGQDKALISIENVTLLEHAYQRLSLQMAQYDTQYTQANNIIISTNNPILLNQRDKIYLADDNEFKNLGPLSGIYTTLNYAVQHDYHAIITIAVDTPFFPTNYFENIMNFYKKQPKNAIFVSYEGAIQPTFALWPVDLIVTLKNHLQVGKRSIYSFAQAVDANQYTFLKTSEKDDNSFFNVNTPDDFIIAKTLWFKQTTKTL